ncbi:SLC13 family permease [Bythopirellula polymerisocia]|uniref:Potassium transporter peripheral membrane component n=1 Tax=Bythopirellula polymerisocia TaxID=2528003 RepID=A0A5C6CZX1_9BACT|nr:SLC13 family permease [Bythopirellula polymerisocia]TWU28496.1 potassium transporter peripheral membrane component [Bythopirellula polymerisocia]
MFEWPLILAQAPSLSFDGKIAIFTTVAIFLAMQRKRVVPIDLLFLSGLVVLTLTGVLTPSRALAGFSNKAVVLIAALFAASAGLRSTGALDWIGNRLLGSATTERSALFRLAAAVVPSSAFILNTPLVAMMAPVVVDWCRQRNISPSRLLIPLSYLTIAGGVCTLIGTSTTLVINGRLAAMVKEGIYSPEIKERIGELTFFEITAVGVPVALVAIGYMLFVIPRRLPDRSELLEQFGEKHREYLVEMHVEEKCPLIGKSVQNAGLRNLPGLFLIEIDRGGETITPVSPQDKIQSGDHLVFTGVVTTIADLERIPGLVPAVDSTFETTPSERTHRQLSEAVLSSTSPLIGLTIRDADFRKLYNAAVVAVHRNGERLTNKVGNVRLEPGDTLLLQTRNEFVGAHRHSRDFYLVSSVGATTARRHDRALLAAILFVGLIGWLTLSSLKPDLLAWGNFSARDVHSIAAITVVLLMIVTRCMTTSEARTAIDLQVLLTIAAALALGEALDQSGAARWLASTMVDGATTLGVNDTWKPYFLLALTYVMAQLFTESITNVAVATTMIPVAVNLAIVAGYDPRPFIVAVTMAASLSFVTPIGYQTNLMVMGPGGYHPRDYWRAGWPLALILTVTALTLIPRIFPFIR